MVDDEEPPSAPEKDVRFLELLQEVARAPHYAPVVSGSIVGEYRVVGQLGRGSHGTVYEAVHVIIEKRAALKVLNPEFSGDPLIVQRFVDEARAVNRIKHPNIVDIFGFGELADGRNYCVMDLLRGATLAQRLKRSGRLQPDEALHVLSEVASALDAAHGAGVVHRDLKPQNIFLSGEEPQRVTLLDFGLARMAGDDRRLRTGSGVLVGTPAYMSPEQCAGVEVDRRTDIYTLGVVAFELLTGRTPFLGSGAGPLVAQHLTATPPRPTELAPDLPAAVDGVFARWLDKEPDARPGTASAAIGALAAALEPASTTTQPRDRRAWGAVLVLLALSVILALWLSNAG